MSNPNSERLDIHPSVEAAAATVAKDLTKGVFQKSDDNLEVIRNLTLQVDSLVSFVNSRATETAIQGIIIKLLLQKAGISHEEVLKAVEEATAKNLDGVINQPEGKEPDSNNRGSESGVVLDAAITGNDSGSPSVLPSDETDGRKN